MAERRRARVTARWVLTIAMIGVLAADSESDREEPGAAASEDSTAGSPFQITSISEADVSPGDAVVVRFEGAEAGRVEARLARRSAEILLRTAETVVVQIPADAANGKAKLQLVDGDQRTKGWDLQIHPNKHKRLVARLLGGLALFVFGLELLAAGLRGLAGNRIRTLLGRWTRSPPQAIGVGVVVGAVTQLTTSAAAFAIGLVDARMVALGSTVAIFVGAQLGAAITGAVLPVAFASEGLLVIAIGVVWTRLSTTRRSAAVSKVVLGMGLMLFGLHLLQTSIQPLVGDPQLLPYVSVLHGDGVGALAACALAGALLALVLQGPGPVYVLVLGLSQTSGVVPVANALAILAGTSLGAAAGMALVAWQARERARPLIVPHLAFGLFATAVALALIPLWRALAPDLETFEYGHRIVRPDVSGWLALAFASTQMLATVAWIAALPALARRATAPAIAPVRLPPSALTASSHHALASIVGSHRVVTATALEISCTADRAPASETEHALAETQRLLAAQYAAVGAAQATPQLERLGKLVVAIQQLQRQIEQVIAVAELGVERGLRLSEDEQQRLHRMHALIDDSFAAVVATLDGDAQLDLEAAGAREIELNMLEAQGRKAPRLRPTNESASVGLNLAALIDTYEHVGNHLFRVSKTLAEDEEI